MVKKAWDIEEAVALINVFFKCKNDDNIAINEELISLSKQLNFRAEKLCVPHDDKYRNLNGMKLMYQNVCYIDSKGKKGLSSISKVLMKAYDMYFSEPLKFKNILNSFEKNYCGGLVGVSDMNNVIDNVDVNNRVLYKGDIDLVYDEMFLIYYLYRSSHEESDRKYAIEREKIFEIFNKVWVHYELDSKINEKTIDIILKIINTFFLRKEESNSYNQNINPFMKAFLLKYENVDIDILNQGVKKIVYRYENNCFDDDNFFQLYRLENIDCFDKYIKECPLSNRTRHGLQESHVHTIFDLLCLSTSNLYGIKRIGVKCIKEIISFAISLKTIPVIDDERKNKLDYYIYLKENSQLLFDGDFSNLSEEACPIISKYKYAHEILDQNLIKACKDNPMYVCDIINAFSKFFIDSDVICKRKDNIKSLFENLSDNKRKNKYFYYAKAYDCHNSGAIDVFYKSKNDKLEDVYYYFDYTNDVGYELLKKFIDWCSFDINLDIKRFFETYYKGRKAEVIGYRANKITLEQIGEKFQITRERVRQLESKIQKEFDRAIVHKKFFHKLLAELNGKSIISFEDVCNFSSEYSNELWFLFRNSKTDYYKYDSKKDVLIVCEDELNVKIQEFIDMLPFSISCNIANEMFIDKFDEELLNDFEFFMGRDYFLYKGYYFRKKLNNHDLLCGIVDAFFSEGIRIYESQELNKLRKIYLDISGMELQEHENDRNLSLRLTRLLIPISKGLYVCKNCINMSSELLNLIKQYIDNDTSEIFMTQTIYKKFEKKLNYCGVNNRYCLHAILKENFSEKYYFFRDFISKNKKITNIQDVVIDYIRKSPVPVDKEQLINQFPGITDIMLSLYLYDSDIINLFGSYIYVGNLLFTSDELLYIKKTVTKIVSDSRQHHSREIYDYIDREKTYLLKSHYIYSQYALFSILEYYFNDCFNLGRPYISQLGVSIVKPLDQIKNKYYNNEYIYLSEILTFTKKMQYQIPCILDFIVQLNDDYYIYDKTKLISNNIIGDNKFRKMIAKEVEKIIESEIVDYLPVIDLTCIYKFPKINVEWTEWLIYSLLNKYSKKFNMVTSTKVFKFAVPIIARSEYDISNIVFDEEYMDLNQKSNLNDIKVDNLDDLDFLLEDIILEEI